MTPTYVLVPGAGGESFYWHRVAPLLGDAIAPDLPAGDEDAGLAEYADTIVAAARDRENVVLVAQSMGAFSAPLACDRLDVAEIVLVAPMIPAPGESAGEWWEAVGQDEAARALARAEGRDPDAPFDLHEIFLHDVPKPVGDALLARPEPRQADKPFEEPWPLPAWPDVPTRVIAAGRDRLIPLELQQRVARERLGVVPEVVDAGHLPALSAPQELTSLLLRAGG
jgi:pimeloyl-ACP methyl ester carboxylesterase